MESSAKSSVLVDPLLVEHQGFTILMFACNQENYAAVRELLLEAEDVNAKTKFGETPLLQAVRYAYKDEDTALRISKLLIDAGAGIDAANIDGETSLMRAVYYGYETLVRFLIEAGADVNAHRSDGNSVLASLEAAPTIARKRKRIIKILEAAGARR